MNHIDLELVDPVKFEELCQHILGDYFGVKVDRTPPTNDGGKDLIVYLPNGKMYVECKHYLNSTVGRPIIQKLQGAMVTDSIGMGMIINTGTFSKDAIEYVANNNLPIKLVDLQTLCDMGQKCGYLLTIGSQNTVVYYTEPKTFDEIQNDLRNYLKTSLESFPTDISNISKIIKKNTVMISFYEIPYLINSTFNTSAGTIHTENDRGVLFIRESTRMIEDSMFSEDMGGHNDSVFDASTIGIPIENSIKILKEDLSKLATDHIIQSHTKNVQYVGKNNQNYSKLCVPSKNDVRLLNAKHVYIPCSFIEYSLGPKKRTVGVAENKRKGIHVFKEYRLQCELCNQNHTQLSLCNDCWRCIGKEHSKTCSVCNKITCVKCSKYFKKWFFIKKPVCIQCQTKIDKKIFSWNK